MATSKPNYAERIHEGRIASAVVEEMLDSRWNGLVDHIGSDHYDNSLEVYFIPETPDDLCATTEDVALILSWGFSRCWLNFYDGTEQYCSASGIGQRQPVRYPKWGKTS